MTQKQREKLIEQIESMLRNAKEQDTETAHMLADDALLFFLTQLGYESIVNLYKEVPKWYA